MNIREVTEIPRERGYQRYDHAAVLAALDAAQSNTVATDWETDVSAEAFVRTFRAWMVVRRIDGVRAIRRRNSVYITRAGAANGKETHR